MAETGVINTRFAGPNPISAEEMAAIQTTINEWKFKDPKNFGVEKDGILEWIVMPNHHYSSANPDPPNGAVIRFAGQAPMRLDPFLPRFFTGTSVVKLHPASSEEYFQDKTYFTNEERRRALHAAIPESAPDTLSMSHVEAQQRVEKLPQPAVELGQTERAMIGVYSRPLTSDQEDDHEYFAITHTTPAKLSEELFVRLDEAVSSGTSVGAFFANPAMQLAERAADRSRAAMLYKAAQAMGVKVRDAQDLGASNGETARLAEVDARAIANLGRVQPDGTVIYYSNVYDSKSMVGGLPLLGQLRGGVQYFTGPGAAEPVARTGRGWESRATYNGVPMSTGRLLDTREMDISHYHVMNMEKPDKDLAMFSWDNMPRSTEQAYNHHLQKSLYQDFHRAKHTDLITQMGYESRWGEPQKLSPVVVKIASTPAHHLRRTMLPSV